MTIEEKRAKYRAFYYKHHDRYRASARERQNKVRANETRGQREKRLTWLRAWQEEKRQEKLAALPPEERLPDFSTKSLAQLYQTGVILLGLLNSKHQAHLEYRRNWRSQKYGSKPRKKAAPKPVKPQRVLLTEEEKRAKNREWQRYYRSIPENRERINEKKRMHSVKLLQEAKGDPEILAALRAKRRASNMGWLDRMKANNPVAYKEHQKKVALKERERKLLNPQYHIVSILRHKVYVAVRRQQAGKGTFNTRELIGCSISDLMKQLEAQWEPGMSWANFGKGVDKWSIDHIRPCASANMNDLGQQKLIFHHSNLRPLWFQENCSKSSNWQGRRWRHSDHACKPVPTV